LGGDGVDDFTYLIYFLFQDKVAEIRAQAVSALQRLQDPKDPVCPIIKAFIFHMGCDPSPIVRRSIVRCIGATRVTLPHVLKRTLDVDENVRKAAYKFIADKVHIRSMTITKREEIVRRGLTDRNEGVRNVVAKDLGKK
jgi:condensin complex subunit 3